MLELQPGNKNAQFLVRLDETEQRTVRGIRRFWSLFGKSLVRQLRKEIMRTPRFGRVYKIRRGKTTRRHTASVPGETAANITGTYRRGSGFQIHGWQGMYFGDSAPYAGFLENGTKRMGARPGLLLAIKHEEGDSLNEAYSSIEKALTRES